MAHNIDTENIKETCPRCCNTGVRVASYFMYTHYTAECAYCGFGLVKGCNKDMAVARLSEMKKRLFVLLLALILVSCFSPKENQGTQPSGKCSTIKTGSICFVCVSGGICVRHDHIVAIHQGRGRIYYRGYQDYFQYRDPTANILACIFECSNRREKDK